MKRTCLVVLVGLVALSGLPHAQANRPLSPRGMASVQVLGSWVKSDRETFTMGGERYQGGKWIDIVYGRPLLRGRDAFGGTGPEYGKSTYAGAPVWRAGADVSTRLKTEVPLLFGNQNLAAGEYSVFIELKQPSEWTLIISNWAAAARFNAPITEGLFGAFGYTPEKDVLRTPMKVGALPEKIEQLTWTFMNMTDKSGEMAIMWDRTMGSAPFKVAPE